MAGVSPRLPPSPPPPPPRRKPDTQISFKKNKKEFPCIPPVLSLDAPEALTLLAQRLYYKSLKIRPNR